MELENLPPQADDTFGPLEMIPITRRSQSERKNDPSVAWTKSPETHEHGSDIASEAGSDSASEASSADEIELFEDTQDTRWDSENGSEHEDDGAVFLKKLYTAYQQAFGDASEAGSDDEADLLETLRGLGSTSRSEGDATVDAEGLLAKLRGAHAHASNGASEAGSDDEAVFFESLRGSGRTSRHEGDATVDPEGLLAKLRGAHEHASDGASETGSSIDELDLFEDTKQDAVSSRASGSENEADFPDDTRWDLGTSRRSTSGRAAGVPIDGTRVPDAREYGFDDASEAGSYEEADPFERLEVDSGSAQGIESDHEEEDDASIDSTTLHEIHDPVFGGASAAELDDEAERFEPPGLGTEGAGSKAPGPSTRKPYVVGQNDEQEALDSLDQRFARLREETPQASSRPSFTEHTREPPASMRANDGEKSVFDYLFERMDVPDSREHHSPRPDILPTARRQATGLHRIRDAQHGLGEEQILSSMTGRPTSGPATDTHQEMEGVQRSLLAMNPQDREAALTAMGFTHAERRQVLQNIGAGESAPTRRPISDTHQQMEEMQQSLLAMNPHDREAALTAMGFTHAEGRQVLQTIGASQSTPTRRPISDTHQQMEEMQRSLLAMNPQDREAALTAMGFTHAEGRQVLQTIGASQSAPPRRPIAGTHQQMEEMQRSLLAMNPQDREAALTAMGLTHAERHQVLQTIGASQSAPTRRPVTGTHQQMEEMQRSLLAMNPQDREAALTAMGFTDAERRQILQTIGASENASTR